MTASEYGFLSAKVAELLSAEYPDIDIIIQVSYNAGLYSPVEDTTVYTVENGSDFDVYFAFQDLTGIEGLIEKTIPGQGSGVGQTQAIASAFAENPIALNGIDGIVDHVYFKSGFEGIDDERNHALVNIPQIFEDYSGSGSINMYITEWSVRNKAGNHESEGTNHTGLQYASSTLEAFFELVSNGVTGANFWPVTYGNETIDRRVLIDTSEEDLTFGGEIFRILSSSLVGLTPVFDFEVEEEIDIHGFSNSNKLVFFASERSGVSNTTEVNFSGYTFEGDIFINVTYLGEDGISGTDINANPIITYLGGFMSTAATIGLDLDPWSLAVIEVQNITEFDDQIYGASSDDRINGNGGDDLLEGLAGNDSLSGNFGHDSLLGGDGDDQLKGGWGDDYILGGSGNDFIAGNYGNNYLDGGTGNDDIRGSEGNNHIEAGDGNDKISLIGGGNFVNAGSGDDEIIVSQSDIEWQSGFGALNLSSVIQMGTGEFIPIDDHHVASNVIVGGAGWDILRLSDSSDALFLDDQYSSFHPNAGAYQLPGGSMGIARISGIEQVFAGLGDDIVDLTSSQFSLSESDIEIFGEQGDDTLWGSDANETISGGEGNDQLFGGAGANVLIGGSGGDTFDFHLSKTGDYITDFNAEDGDELRIFGTSNTDGHTISWDGEVLSIVFEFEDYVTTFSANVQFENSLEGENFFVNTWHDSIVFL
jgi:Ca2+-binding RTX toxin-like protein